MTGNIVPLGPGPIAPEHRAALGRLRRDLTSQHFALNDTDQLARAIVSIIDCLMPGLAEGERGPEATSAAARGGT